MTRRVVACIRRYLAERREAAQVPAGWSTPEAAAELARIVREQTAEREQVRPRTLPEPGPYRPRHAADGERDEQTEGYEPRRDGSQPAADTGYLLDFAAYYREHGRHSNRQWRAEPWGFLRDY
ncbi:hypothetical protein [Micromonospora sp. WMMD1082]|uniref:hypothetical protein n=1 Tax=Micromonospora sp. WMMD1082 TaxID=3016104 RepID=UPI002417DF0F|nr:hypothetical protein [Micromonospora sp. WMMD1082]MDG4792733.1 hypothetical protein [Micromonospora sp. WMMD1082]